MNPARYQRVKAALRAVIDAPEEARAEALDTACVGDQTLRAEVETLLAEYDSPGVDLEPGARAVRAALTSSHLVQPIPERIGRYRIVGVLGEGGMGMVLHAEQERPRRSVALKLLRPAFATDDMVRRFEREMDILSRLDHPGIAQIYEAGSWEAEVGTQPFFAMELVDGDRLIDHAVSNELDLRARLELLAKACDAVQYAHRQGVIHRDLKPSNILVDSTGGPKILDFGIARTTDVDIQRTTATGEGQLLGTLAYMSPEQVEGRAAAIDTRTDIYSLGTVAYELLTGRLPLEIDGRGVIEAAQMIRDDDPPPLGEVDQGLRGDVETIVRRAMDKDPSRRYQSAAALGDDIRRHLDGDPIDAKRDSIPYLLRKRLRRYRLAAAFALTVTIALAAFAVYAVVQAEREKELADQERAARAEADAATDDAEAVTAFLAEMLGMTDAGHTRAADTRVVSLMDGLSDDVGRFFEGQPDAEAQVHAFFGQTYFVHGRLDRAEHHLRRSCELREGRDDVTDEELYEVLWPLLHVLIEIDDILHRDHRLRAERLARAIVLRGDEEIGNALQFIRDTPNADWDDDAPRAAFETALARAGDLAPHDPLRLYVGDLLYLFGLSQMIDGTGEVALRFHEAALDVHTPHLEEGDVRLERTHAAIVHALVRAERFADAETLARALIDQLANTLPDDHWYVALQKTRLAAALIGQGEFDESERLLLDGYDAIVAAVGEASGMAAGVLHGLADLYSAQGRDDEVAAKRRQLALARAGIEIYASVAITLIAWGPEHEALAEEMRELVHAMWANSSDVPEMIAVFFEHLDEQLGDDPVLALLVADVLTRYGKDYAFAYPPDVMRAMFEKLAELDRAAPHRHVRKQALTLYWLARLATHVGDHAAGEAIAADAVERLESGPPEHYGFIGAARALQGQCIASQRRFAEAERILLQAYDELATALGEGDGDTMHAAVYIVMLYEMWRRPDKSGPYLRKRVQALVDGGSSPPTLQGWLWTILRFDGHEPDVFAVAREVVDRWREMPGADSVVDLRVAEALLLLREGRVDELAAALDVAASLPPARTPEHRCRHLAVIALCHDALGDDVSARAALDELEGIANTRASWDDHIFWLRGEASRVIGE